MVYSDIMIILMEMVLIDISWFINQLLIHISSYIVHISSIYRPYIVHHVCKTNAHLMKHGSAGLIFRPLSWKVQRISMPPGSRCFLPLVRLRSKDGHLGCRSSLQLEIGYPQTPRGLSDLCPKDNLWDIPVFSILRQGHMISGYFRNFLFGFLQLKPGWGPVRETMMDGWFCPNKMMTCVHFVGTRVAPLHIVYKRMCALSGFT